MTDKMMEETNSSIENLLTPSQWCRRMGPEEVLNSHLKIVTEESDSVKQTIPCQLNIPYGDTDGQKLDLFGFNSMDKDGCIFVYIHGGYWQDLSRFISSYCVKPLVSAGHAVVIVGYDLAPKVTLHEIIQEIKKAIEYIVKIAEEENIKSVFISGHSAGAHLTASLFTSKLLREKRHIIKGFILIGGLFDLRKLIVTSVNDALKLTRSQAEECSPLLQVLAIANDVIDDFPVLVLVGEHESPEFIRQSLLYSQDLKRQGAHVDCHVIKDVDHFDIVEGLRDKDFQVTQMILKFIKTNC